MTKFKSLLTALALMLTVVFIGCSDDDDNNMLGSNPEPTMNIVETAIEAGNFTTLVAAVEAAGLVDALSGDDILTVFAPTDEAFAALPSGTVEALLNDIPTLASILTYHVIAGEVKAEQVVTLNSAQTLNGQSVTITITNDGNVMIDNATVIVTDIEATNGVIHVIDAVIIPSNSSSIAPYSAKSAPTTSFTTSSDDMSMNMKRTGPPIYGLANKAGLTTLAAAIEATGLNKTLNTGGLFTVFAPTEEAFAALPEGTIEALLADPETLTNILLYHVVEGEYTASDVLSLEDGTKVTMLNGQQVTVNVTDVMVNDANVIATDIFAKNGVVHLIDKVLIP